MPAPPARHRFFLPICTRKPAPDLYIRFVAASTDAHAAIPAAPVDAGRCTIEAAANIPAVGGAPYRMSINTRVDRVKHTTACYSYYFPDLPRDAHTFRGRHF